MKLNKLFLLLILCFGEFAFAQNNVYGKLEIPKVKENETVIHHTAYSFLYNEVFEQASWVAYILSGKETISIVKRTDNFRPDPSVKTGTANNKDYSKSGYDRGHLAPAADMGWSKDAMSESFYYSNISPQVQGFNRIYWKRCEDIVRRWAVTYDSIYVVTGPVLREGLATIGKNEVAVPMFFFKVIMRYNSQKNEGTGIAFVMPNIGTKAPLKSFIVSIDKVERMTGIDFFPLLPDDIEQQIERNDNPNDWKWE